MNLFVAIEVKARALAFKNDATNGDEGTATAMAEEMEVAEEPAVAESARPEQQMIMVAASRSALRGNRGSHRGGGHRGGHYVAHS